MLFRFSPLFGVTGMLRPMAAPDDYLDTADLKSIAANGWVREDVMREIFDCSEIPTPFLDMVREGTCKNSYTEWPEDELAAPSITNAAISGADTTITAQATTGALRVGNHTQISTKNVAVTERAQNTDNVQGDALAYRTMRKMQELRRDVEAIVLTGQASVADNGNDTAGKTAGLSAWIVSHDSSGAGGGAPGFQTGTKLVTVVTAGAARALTWDMVATQIEGVYSEGSNPTVLMSVPGVTKRLGRYLFTTPFAAVPTANVNGTGGGVDQTSQGYIDTFRTDFGFTMKIIPNRLQQTYASADSAPVQVAAVFGIDTDYVEMGYLHTYKVEPLGKTGLSHKRLLSVDYALKVLLERAHFCIRDINPTAAVTAS